MTRILVMLLLAISALPAFAQSLPSPTPLPNHHAAPAPLIGAGLPVAVIAGLAWLGYRLLKRQK